MSTTRSAPMTASQFLQFSKMIGSYRLPEFLTQNKEMLQPFRNNAEIVAYLVSNLSCKNAINLLTTHQITLASFQNEDEVVRVIAVLFKSMFMESADKVVDAVDYLEKNDEDVRRITKVGNVLQLMNLIIQQVMNPWRYRVDNNTVNKLLDRLLTVFRPSIASLENIADIQLMLHALDGDENYMHRIKLEIARIVSPHIKNWEDLACVLKGVGYYAWSSDYIDELIENQKKNWTTKTSVSLFNSPLPTMSKQGFISMIDAFAETLRHESLFTFINEYEAVVLKLNNDSEVMQTVIRRYSREDLEEIIRKFNIRLENFASDADKSAIAIAVIKKCYKYVAYLLKFLHENKSALQTMIDPNQIIAIIKEAEKIIEQYCEPATNVFHDHEPVRLNLMDEVASIFTSCMQKITDMDAALQIMSAFDAHNKLSRRCNTSFAMALTNAVHTWDDLTSLLQHVADKGDVLKVFDAHKIHLLPANIAEPEPVQEDVTPRRKLG